MAKKIAQQMTRVVVIGSLESYELVTEPFKMGKGVIALDNGNKVRFTAFDSKPDAANPHTKATDISKLYQTGDRIYISGNDNRSYSEAKDAYYEDVQLWDHRKATPEEQSRWVFVYVGDLKQDGDKGLALSFIDYKDKEMLFHLNTEKCAELDEIEEGTRVKLKGEIFSGFKADYFGDGEYVTERLPMHVEVLHTAEELAEDAAGGAEEGNLW